MDLFQTSFMPHGHCYFWLPQILWLHVISDAFVTLSYYSIPLALFYFLKKRQDFQYPWIIILFALFILSCGTNHLISIITTWKPWYFQEGIFKAITALISLITALLLWPLIPKLLALPSPKQLAEANQALAAEIQERITAQNGLEDLNQKLEARVAQRTQELSFKIHALLEAQAQIQAQTKKLEKSNAELEEYAYVVSHDLRSPLRNIMSFTELLAQRYQNELDQKAQKYLQYILGGTQQMNQIINDLLAYAKLNTEKPAPQVTDLNQLLQQVYANFEHEIQEKNVIWESETLPNLEIQPTEIILVFQNLIGNAIKFNLATPPQLKISCKEDQGFWQFCIQDNGIGFEPSQAKRIFQIFQRLHDEKSFSGTGMGLANCKKIIERYGGKIWAESIPGQGSQFYFTLPQISNKL